jgi:hypothetical protein
MNEMKPAFSAGFSFSSRALKAFSAFKCLDGKRKMRRVAYISLGLKTNEAEVTH